MIRAEIVIILPSTTHKQPAADRFGEQIMHMSLTERPLHESSKQLKFKSRRRISLMATVKSRISTEAVVVRTRSLERVERLYKWLLCITFWFYWRMFRNGWYFQGSFQRLLRRSCCPLRGSREFTFYSCRHWYNVIYTYARGEARLYVNGKLIHASKTNAVFTPNNRNYILESTWSRNSILF